MQTVCDRQNLLWISPMHQSSTHNSTAFFLTELFELLQNLEENLSFLGFLSLEILYIQFPGYC